MKNQWSGGRPRPPISHERPAEAAAAPQVRQPRLREEDGSRFAPPAPGAGTGAGSKSGGAVK